MKLFDLEINEVSLVDKGANNKKFLLFKRDTQGELKMKIRELDEKGWLEYVQKIDVDSLQRETLIALKSVFDSLSPVKKNDVVKAIENITSLDDIGKIKAGLEDVKKLLDSEDGTPVKEKTDEEKAEELKKQKEEEEKNRLSKQQWKYCICTKCGFAKEKVAAEPCKLEKCPDCGSPLTGSDVKVKKDEEEPTEEQKAEQARVAEEKEDAEEKEELEKKLSELKSSLEAIPSQEDLEKTIKDAVQAGLKE